jgi:C4-dicarboxylate-specific signal transduction histidine kinase
MNPMAEAALGSILRWAFAIVAGYIVKQGIWSAGDAERYVAAAAIATLSLAWSAWNKYRGRMKLVTALQLAQATEHQVEARIADPNISNPSVNTKKTDVPT